MAMKSSLLLLLIFSYKVHALNFGSNFKRFLEKSYPHLVDDRPAYGGGVVGQSKHTPVILIHGNSDRAVTNNFPVSSNKWGWNNLISYLLRQGYDTQDIYAISWGDMDETKASLQYHSYKNIKRIRDFIQAVKTYTKSDEVNIVTHSMGVTLVRKAIQGGFGNDLLRVPSYYYLGPQLDYIKTFIGIAGANRGLKNCYKFPQFPTCALSNGLHPNSTLIFTLATQDKFAENIVSICSHFDHLVEAESCELPYSKRSYKFNQKEFTHFTVKTFNSELIWRILDED